MGQLNIRLTPDFDRKLARLMELRDFDQDRGGSPR